MLAKVEELDTKLGTLLAKLEDAGMSNDINILIAADHGMFDQVIRESYALFKVM